MCRPWSVGHDPARCLCACVRVRVCSCVRVCGVCVCVCVRACVLSRAAWHTVCVNCDKTIKIDPVIRDSHRGKKVSLGTALALPPPRRRRCASRDRRRGRRRCEGRRRRTVRARAQRCRPAAEPVVKVEALLLLLDDDLDLDECIGRHGRDNARLANEEEGSDDRPKRQRKQ